MAGIKISALPSAITLTGTEIIPVVQSGTTTRTLLSAIAAYISSTLSGFVPTSRTVSAGTGLSGGGALTANITLSLNVGNTNGWTAAQGFTEQALTDAATVVWNASTQQVAVFTFVSTNRTMGTPSNMVAGYYYGLCLIQNAGSNTMSWPSVYKWIGGSAPTLTTTAAGRDYFVFRSDGTNMWEQGRAQADA